MARVTVPDQLSHLTDGVREVEVAAATYRELVAALGARFAGLGEELEELAVAIDGDIFQDPFLEPLQADSEVYFLQKIEGG